MKIAQFLATIPDAIPFEYAVELRDYSLMLPYGYAICQKRRMASELGLQAKPFQSF